MRASRSPSRWVRASPRGCYPITCGPGASPRRIPGGRCSCSRSPPRWHSWRSRCSPPWASPAGGCPRPGSKSSPRSSVWCCLEAPPTPAASWHSACGRATSRGAEPRDEPFARAFRAAARRRRFAHRPGTRLRMRGGTLALDPLGGGAQQSEAELRERLQRVIPEGTAGGVAVGELPLDQFLEPASNRQILARVLRNLKGIYREKDKPERMLEVLNRMLVVAPDASSELRDRGYVYRRLECWRPALKDLSDYVEREPEAPDLDDVRVKLMELSALCARLN